MRFDKGEEIKDALIRMLCNTNELISLYKDHEFVSWVCEGNNVYLCLMEPNQSFYIERFCVSELDFDINDNDFYVSNKYYKNKYDIIVVNENGKKIKSELIYEDISGEYVCLVKVNNKIVLCIHDTTMFPYIINNTIENIKYMTDNYETQL